jgi:hypothetical protein
MPPSSLRISDPSDTRHCGNPSSPQAGGPAANSAPAANASKAAKLRIARLRPYLMIVAGMA